MKACLVLNRPALNRALLTVALCWLSSWSHAEKLQDPTRPLQYHAPVANVEHLQLNSILVASGRRFAVINGRALAENEAVGGIRVVRIEKDRVIVRQGGKTKTLVLHRDIKQ